jgi:hypothetical protein
VTWGQLLQLVSRACAEQGAERRVLLVLRDATYHVKELVDTDPPGQDGLLAFVVYKDDPALSSRTEDTLLVCVRPDRVERVQITKGDQPDGGGTIGFVSG